MFAAQMPHVKFILPTAPTQPVTMNMGMPMPSWYDIVGLDERSNENCKGLPDSRARIEGILKTEHDNTGLPYSRMLLAGFSQGGALALFTGLQLEESLAGVVVLSGYLPAAKQFKPKQLKTPVWHGHGTMDPMVQFTMAEKTKQTVTSLGVEDYTLETFPIPHSVSPPELQKVLAFISKVLPPDESFKVQVKDPKDMSVKELKAAIRKAGLGSKAVGFMEKSEFVKLLQDYRDGK
jgi:lysophospholipase-2